MAAKKQISSRGTTKSKVPAARKQSSRVSRAGSAGVDLGAATVGAALGRDAIAIGNTSAKKFLQSSLGMISRSRGDATDAVAEGLGRFAESIGLRKLEDVFDQRVAGALERMGIPTAREISRLRDSIEQLSRQVDELKAKQRR